jgi:hypothetical protein
MANKKVKGGAKLKLCLSLILLLYNRVLTRKPAVVADSEEGPGLHPVEGEKGEVGIDDAVNEIHIPFLVDVVVHPDQGEDSEAGEEFHRHEGVEPEGDEEHAQKEVGQWKFDLGDEEIQDGQQPVFRAVSAEDELELYPIFPKVAAVPAQVHAA